MKNVEIGNRMKNIRINKGMSREQLAERAGVSSKFVYEIEHGIKGMSVETLSRISKVLGESCDFLVYGEEKEGGQQGKGSKNY